MIAKSNFSNSIDKYEHCPIPQTHRRLADAHLLWHQTLDRYQEPDAFRANLNSTIEALRNVTFVLQNEHAAFTNFDEWYDPWRARLKANSAAKWLHDARTTVVHQGELESHSAAEVRLVTWQDEVVASLKVPVEIPSSLILQNLRLLDLLEKSRAGPGDLKDAAIAIERRWSTEGLGELELLQVLAGAYGLLSDVVLDAHVLLNKCECISAEADHPDFRSVYHRTGTLECMAAGAERRTQIFKLATGERLSPTQVNEAVPFGEIDADKRYGFGEEAAIAAWEKLDPVRFGEKILHRAKRILCRDKYHQRMMFIRDGRGAWHLHALFARDRTEKHLLMRMAAQFVESKGCDAIVEVGEMWSAPIESMRGLDLSEIQHAKGRGEILFVMVATREGISRTYMTPFTRGRFGGIKLGNTRRTEGKFQAYFEPILDVWRRQGIVRRDDGKASRWIWEPDGLDICFCGGPKRFAECCQPHLPLKLHNSLIEIHKAMAARQFGRAEELSRATLAQYVIWVKRHTAGTMHVAHDLYEKLVGIDLPALEASVRLVQECLEANGNAELFVPQTRRLAEIIGVPRLSIRLVGLASQWLLRSGKIEEAILEIDSLGDLDKIDDSLALVTAADILDLSPEKREKVLVRASSLAVDEEEKWDAQFALVAHMLSRGETERALPIVDSIITESSAAERGAEPQAEARMLRWRITKATTDFQLFYEAIDQSQSSARRRYGAILIDEGMYNESEQLLGAGADSGDPIHKLLVTDARVRSGKAASAREMFFSIERGQLPSELRYPYAVVAAQLALSCKDETLRQVAIRSLREPPVSAAMDGVEDLLLSLEGARFCDAPPE